MNVWNIVSTLAGAVMLYTSILVAYIAISATPPRLRKVAQDWYVVTVTSLVLLAVLVVFPGYVIADFMGWIQ
jgi:hypothetical protein